MIELYCQATRVIDGKEVETDQGWRWSQETIDKRLEENPHLIYWTSSNRPRYKIYADEYEGKQVGNLWTGISPLSSNETEMKIDFTTQKPERLIQRIIEMSSDKRDIVLDAFLGSGTTTATAHKIGRKWIGIEMGDYFGEFYNDEEENEKIGALGRIKEVLAGWGEHEPCGISKEVGWNGGGFFKYYKLEQYEQALKNCVYEPSEPFSKSEKPTPTYNQYVFMKDEKMLDAVELDFEEEEEKIDFSNLYSNVDLAETLSNLKGKKIKEVTENSVTFEDGEKIEYDDLDFETIKPLIWW